MPDGIMINAPQVEHTRQFNERIYRISAENFPLVMRRDLQTIDEVKKEYAKAAKSKISKKMEKFRVFKKLYDQNPWFAESLSKDVKSLIDNKLKEASLLSDALALTFERQGIDTVNLSFKKNFHYKNNKTLKSADAIKKELEKKGDAFEKALGRDYKITKILRSMCEDDQRRRDEEIARTEAPENAGYKKAKRLLKDVPKEMRAGFDEAPETMTEDIGDFKILKFDFRSMDEL